LHVVKANETLFHVASLYDLSVGELRKLNRLGPRENVIRPGQRLKVSI
jgi:LysM repeat protein